MYLEIYSLKEYSSLRQLGHIQRACHKRLIDRSQLSQQHATAKREVAAHVRLTHSLPSTAYCSEQREPTVHSLRPWHEAGWAVGGALFLR